MSYTNYRGEQRLRSLIPIQIYYGETDYHLKPQWLLRGFDLDKQDERTYALADCDFTEG